jgi:hypothetical protein
VRAQTVRLVRLMLPGGNPVGRGVDRLEGVSLIVAVLLAMLLVPVMLMAGSLTYATAVATAERQERTRHQVVATLVEDAPKVSEGGAGPARVLARWGTPAGPRTGRVLTEDGRAAGERVRTWLNEAGEPVAAPAGLGEAAFAGGFVAITGRLTAVSLLAGIHSGVKRLLDRRRYRAWTQEWALVEPRRRTGSPSGCG